MSGTNGAPTRRSTRHRQRSARTLKVLAGAVPVVLVGVGLALVVVNGGVKATLDASAATCADPTHVTVSTTREFLPVLRKVASGVEEAAGDRAGCPAFEVTASAPAAAVSQVTGGGPDAPDVWVPDSSVWVQRANAQLGGDSLSQPVTVAQSPLVVAVPQARAA
ncbi:MAG: substrate-binding domain-containing protein, partial [Oryzihumus sp.]